MAESELGPIDYVIVEFPTAKTPFGRDLAGLCDQTAETLAMKDVEKRVHGHRPRSCRGCDRMGEHLGGTVRGDGTRIRSSDRRAGQDLDRRGRRRSTGRSPGGRVT